MAPHVARTFCVTCDVCSATTVDSSPTWKPSSFVFMALMSMPVAAQYTMLPEAPAGAMVNVPDEPVAAVPPDWLVPVTVTVIGESSTWAARAFHMSAGIVHVVDVV